MKTPTIERRYITQPVEVRATSLGKGPQIRGYAALYNSRSDNLGGKDRPFFEVIEPGAFDDVLNDDVRALFNHDANLILARSRGGKGTLRLYTDERGLGYEFTPGDTTAGRDLLVSVERGDVDQSSFAFTVAADGDRWTDKDGIITRTIKKVARLFDVSPVTYPAYPDTAVALRSLEHFEQEQKRTPPGHPKNGADADRERRIRFLKLSCSPVELVQD